MAQNAKTGGAPPKIDIFQKYFTFNLLTPKYIKKIGASKFWKKRSV